MTESSTGVGQEGERDLRHNVVALGWVAFFGGFSQDLIQPILPLFYSNVLGLPKELIGLIEGVLNTTVALTKIGAGWVSDYLRRRKALVWIGYALSAVARPGFAFVTAGWQAMALRFTDGIGKGLKDAPRDALVAGSSQSKNLGWAFGLQRMLDTLGSVIGPLATFGILRLFAKPSEGYRYIFLLSGVVALFTLVITGLAVKERSRDKLQARDISLRLLKGRFAVLLLVVLVFTLGNSSDAFLLLRAQDLGVKAALIPVVYALFNLSYAGLALPAGYLSDRVGRRAMLLAGWIIYAVVYLGFASASQTWHVWVLWAVYGAYYATSEGAAKALVAEVVPDAERGTAYGLFNASIGVMALPASFIAGWLWSHYGAAAPFWFGAVMAAVAVALLMCTMREQPASTVSHN